MTPCTHALLWAHDYWPESRLCHCRWADPLRTALSPPVCRPLPLRWPLPAGPRRLYCAWHHCCSRVGRRRAQRGGETAPGVRNTPRMLLVAGAGKARVPCISWQGEAYPCLAPVTFTHTRLAAYYRYQRYKFPQPGLLSCSAPLPAMHAAALSAAAASLCCLGFMLACTAGVAGLAACACG